MKSLWLMLMASFPLHGAVILDASASTSALLHPGDSLAFRILTWNFGFNAARFGLADRYPTDVSFTFVTAPLAVHGSPAVSAWLESPDASVSVQFAGPLVFVPGIWSTSQYRGSVATLQGSLHLSDRLSTEIFGTGAAQLVLRNDGGEDVLLGLPPGTLRQDLSVSLSGGPLSVGALSGDVSLESQVPEPATLLPALLALALIWHMARPKNQPFANS